MRNVRIGNHRVLMYDSIDDLPMERFHRYNKFMLIDAGLGSDISTMDAHIEKVTRFMSTGDTESALKELENLRQNIYLVQTEQSPKNLSFACLVAEIDGKEYNDLSEDGLEKVRQLLMDAPRGDVAGVMSAAKKKIDDALMEYFPQMFVSAEEKEYYDMMKRRTVAMLEQIAEGESTERQQTIDTMTDRLVTAVKPKVFTGRSSFQVQHDKGYEKMCLLISSTLGVDAKRMTVLEYYTANEYVHELAKERKKAASKRR